MKNSEMTKKAVIEGIKKGQKTFFFNWVNWSGTADEVREIKNILIEAGYTLKQAKSYEETNTVNFPQEDWKAPIDGKELEGKATARYADKVIKYEGSLLRYNTETSTVDLLAFWKFEKGEIVTTAEPQITDSIGVYKEDADESLSYILDQCSYRWDIEASALAAEFVK